MDPLFLALAIIVPVNNSKSTKVSYFIIHPIIVAMVTYML